MIIRPSRRAILVRGTVITLLGMPGVFSLVMVIPGIDGVERAAVLANPLAFLLAAAFIGAALAPRVGLHSRLLDRQLRRHGPVWARALAVGITAGIVVAAIDQVSSPLWRVPGATTLTEAWTPAAFVSGALYGGITEEIIMRWGLLTLFVWMFWRILASRSERPSRPVVWFGVFLCAIFFAAGHVPALSLTTLDPGVALVLRTLILNAALGVLFGAYYVRHDLESAIAAHLGFHVGVALAAFAATIWS
jgi:membrane protease YdiL (CAAX protease family)